MSLRRLVLGYASLFAVSCAPTAPDGATLTAADAGRFDVNDVSFLYPLPQTQAAVSGLLPMPQLSRADYETLVPTAKDARIHPHGGDEPNPIFDMNVFKVVGIRVDPCAKDDPKKPDCRIEFRLILQPVGEGMDRFQTGVATFDAALHMIYEVPASERRTLVDGLRRLKGMAGARTSGKPLGVHPVIAAEGLGGAYDQELRRMVAAFAIPERLHVATHLNVFESDRWFFSKTEREGGRLVRKEIPFTDSDLQEFKVDGSTHVAKIMQNPSKAADNTNDIMDSVVAGSSRFFGQSEAAKRAQIEAAIRIENPLTHTPATLDCVSCHVATRALNRAQRGVGDTGGGIAGAYAVPAGVTGDRSLDFDENIWSTRAFGYFSKKASITKGTINDSAKVAAALNAEVGGGVTPQPQPPNPNPQPQPQPQPQPPPPPPLGSSDDGTVITVSGQTCTNRRYPSLKNPGQCITCPGSMRLRYPDEICVP